MLFQRVFITQCDSGVDLGFYKGGCPIHLKGAPEVERRRRGEEWGLIFVFLISKW